MRSPLQLPLGTLVVEPCQGPASSEPVPSSLVLLSQLEFTGVCWGLPWPSSPHPTAQGHSALGVTPERTGPLPWKQKPVFKLQRETVFISGL